jgi:hypothetical protein
MASFMDRADKWHLGGGFAVAALAACAWSFGWNSRLSALAVILCNLYLVSILIEASFRAQQERKVLDGVLQPKPDRFMSFPGQTWSLVQVQFVLIVAILGFANMYTQSGDIRYQGPAARVEQPDAKVPGAAQPNVRFPPSVDRLDALYFSAVTFTTLGYGDFAPASSRARLLVLWELATGMLTLLGVFPLIVGRISDF